ncbi:hypothetical protein ABIE27_003143 [Paenibacillus sp. 4624]|uniref:MvaI/BcnI family restriction endonuclease n=1 Tax=Paenibacillus sp. 4624 TaxID=3156453 RepID=UPI003D1B1A5A
MKSSNIIEHYFENPYMYEDFFCKILTKNDDSGRHGVLIPVYAYRLFPEFEGFDTLSEINYEASIITYWFKEGNWIEKKSKWKHYHRYPERRMTSLSPELLNNKPENSIMLFAKLKESFEYYCVLIPPKDKAYNEIANLFRFNLNQEKISGLSAVFAYEDLKKAIKEETTPLDELIEMVKEIEKKQFISTLRAGDTGIGYTFETLIGISANSSKIPDFKGIEIKCSRSKKPKSKRTAQTGKQTLFSLIPNWSAIENRRRLVEEFGEEDLERERLAIYCTIKVNPNRKLWSLSVSEEDKRIYILHKGIRVVYYSFEDLKNALENKHKESAFIIAHARKNSEGNEEFHYDTLIHAKEVLFEEFVALVKENIIGIDFAIHLKAGKVRDHGFLWRLENKKHLLRLFKYVQEVI